MRLCIEEDSLTLALTSGMRLYIEDSLTLASHLRQASLLEMWKAAEGIWQQANMKTTTFLKIQAYNIKKKQ
jgi:hypothetical protein